MDRPLCLLLALSLSALADDPRGFPASEAKWESVYGHRESEKDTVYSIMGCGFESAPLSKDLDRVVKDWIASHPAARVVPVATYRFSRDKQDYTRTWVWLLDGGENLADVLVRQGCCPAGIMAVPGGKTLVSEDEYKAFLDTLRKSEGEAVTQHVGIWDAESAGEELMDKAEALKAGKKYREAIDGYQAALAKGADAESCWTAIGECEEALGEYQAALSAYDRAMADGSPAAVGARARCVSHHEGPAVADAWLAALADRAPAGEDRARLLFVRGVFHLEEGRPRSALPSFSACAQIRSDLLALRYADDGALVLDAASGAKPQEACEAIATPLRFAARCCLDMKDLDGAFRYATMGLTLMQQVRRAGGKSSKEDVEAGDCRCRLIRATVLGARKRLDDARRELELAKLLAARGISEEEKGDIKYVQAFLEEEAKQK